MRIASARESSYIAFAILELFDENIDLIARFDCDAIAVSELFKRNDAFGLESDIDDDGLVGNLFDSAFDNFTFADLSVMLLFVPIENGAKVLH
jgi:hypothetical protein